ncbi:sigma-70 family RNA polymerase sigma factor [Bacillus cereus]|nr:sigma-70 family RNA polymerase sigma factor [Bacillus cereus]MDA2572115.1 sigma-70 family RNA polymerase sigma factor [Bacillus cereus]
MNTLLRKAQCFIKERHPNKSDVIYIKSLAEEIKNFFGVTTDLDLNSLSNYLKYKGYENIKKQCPNIHPKVEGETTNTADSDFSLESFFEEQQDNISINDLNSFKDNKLLFEKSYQETEYEKQNQIKEQIITNNQKLVLKIAKKYVSISNSLKLEDLINEGNLGLIKAIERYDLSKGYEFSTYALPWIRQAITRAIANTGNIIRIPVHAIDSIYKIRKIEKELEIEKADYTIEDVLNNYEELTLRKYLTLKEIEFKFLHNISLNNSLESDSDEEYIDFISSVNNDVFFLSSYLDDNVEEAIIQRDLYEILIKEINKLTARERDIIKYRFGFINGETRTLEEIGNLFGVTRERIRQIEYKAIKKLKDRLFHKQLDEYL